MLKIVNRKIVSVLCFGLCAGMMFSSCGNKESKLLDVPVNPGAQAPAKGSVESADSNVVEVKATVAEVVQVDPDLEKLDAVYSLMSDRFKGDVHFQDQGEKEEFLKDLKNVLNEEKKFPTNGNANLYYLIDKKHNIGSDYEPNDLVKLSSLDDRPYNINRNDLSLREGVEKALCVLARAAQNDGITLLVSSTYRSYDYQAKLFQRWVDIDGLEEAERESARPGTSQHQLGLAIDFGSIEDDFIYTKQGKWLYQHAWEYGWSLSFPKQYEDVTGYRWECWHYRYVGIDACKFQRRYFNDVQQYMLEFIDAWKNYK